MRALLSVYDKSGIVDLARELADLGVELVSSGFGPYRLYRPVRQAIGPEAAATP